jgi:uncharacterized membrane protein
VDWVTLVLLVLLVILPVVVQVAAFGAIFYKAGYSGWLGLLMLVPVVSLVLLVWFATTKWPIELAAKGPMQRTDVDEAWEQKMLLRKALNLEKEGRWDEALSHWREVIARSASHPDNAALAREHIRAIQDRKAHEEGGDPAGFRPA